MSVTTIVEIQKNLGRYGLSILIVLGNIAATIINWILINTNLISTVYGVDHVDPQHRSIVVCKLRWYRGQILLMLSRSFMIAACVDRWALTSSNIKIRSFCRPQIARYVIICLTLIWPIIPVHMAIYVNNYSGHCGAPSYYALAFAIYLFIFVSILPPLLMIIFGILAWCNLKLIQMRIAPMNKNAQIRFHKADRDLMKMLFGEVLIYIITTALYPVNVLYSVITTPIAEDKSEMRLAVESLIGYIISPVLNYIYCVAQFYIYAICSSKFRSDFIQLSRRQPIL